MRTVQRPDHMSLSNLLSRLQEGRFVIPDFQREFEWRPWDINALIKSIFLDYYIGSLLLWKGKRENFNALSCETIYGFNGSKHYHSWDHGHGTAPEHIVLDGQQRLTAIYYAFISPDVPLPNKKTRAFYFLNLDKFMKEEYDEAFIYEWTSRQINHLMKTPELQYKEHLFPISIIKGGGWDVIDWIRGYKKYWEDVHNDAVIAMDEKLSELAQSYANFSNEFSEFMRNLTDQYQIVFIELDQNLEVDKICDIFTQINSKGIRLDVFDLVNALLKPKDLQLKKMWRDASTKLNFVETEKMNVYVLQVMSILLQNYCSPKYLYYLIPGQEKLIRSDSGRLVSEILVPNKSRFVENWNNAVQILSRSIDQLRHPQEFGAISSKFIPYTSILPVFAALRYFKSNLSSNMQLIANTKIRKWYWASVFSNRYSGSIESTSAKDFIEMKKWMQDTDEEPLFIKDFINEIDSLDLEREAKKGSSIYNGVFNILVIAGAKDWRTGDSPQYDDLDDHHIVPFSKAKTELIGANINTILNRTPLTSETNRSVIRDKYPYQYLPELMSELSQEQVLKIMETHLISEQALNILLRNPFTLNDYKEFITERRNSIIAAIRQLLT